MPKQEAQAPPDSRGANIVAAVAFAISATAVVVVEGIVAERAGHHVVPGGGLVLGVPLALFALFLAIRAFTGERR